MLSRFRKGLARLLARRRLAVLLIVLAASAASGVALRGTTHSPSASGT